MDTALIAGFPKSGNTLLGATSNIAGGVGTHYDVYHLRSVGQEPEPNKLFHRDICTIKTHDSRRWSSDLRTSYYGTVVSIVTIVRNPFETLLSTLAFLRYLCEAKGSLSQDEVDCVHSLLPGYVIGSAFSEEFTLDNLRDQGLISVALSNFAKMGTVIPLFYAMSGPWSEFVLSYLGTGIPTLNLRYEDLSQESLGEQESHSQCTKRLSEFWDCSYWQLKRAFIQQGIDAQNAKAYGSLFFSKAESGYWKSYYDLADCKKFADLYYRSIIANGYEDLMDDLFSS